MARAAARAAGAASAAVKRCRSGAGADEATGGEYRIFISTSCTLRAASVGDGGGGDNGEKILRPALGSGGGRQGGPAAPATRRVISFARPPDGREDEDEETEHRTKSNQHSKTESEDVVELMTVAPLEEFASLVVPDTDQVESTFIADDSEPGSPTSVQPRSALQMQFPPTENQSRPAGPGCPNSLLSDQLRLQAARDAYTAAKAMPHSPRSSSSLPKLSVARRRAVGSHEASTERRYSSLSTGSSRNLCQLRRLLNDNDAVRSFSSSAPTYASLPHPPQTQRRQTAGVEGSAKSASLYDLADTAPAPRDLRYGRGSNNSDALGKAASSRSCGSLIDSQDETSHSGNSGHCRFGRAQRAASHDPLDSVRGSSGGSVGARRFVDWLEHRAKSQRELDICHSLTRLEMPAWLDNLPALREAPENKGGNQNLAATEEETRHSWHPDARFLRTPRISESSANCEDNESVSRASAPIVLRPRAVPTSMSLPTRLAAAAVASKKDESESVPKPLRSHQLEGSCVKERVRYFTESSLHQKRQRTAPYKKATIHELAANLYRPSLAAVTLKPEDFQPRNGAPSASKPAPRIQPPPPIQKRADSGASMDDESSAASITSTASSSEGSSEVEVEQKKVDPIAEEPTVVQTSIVYTRILSQTVRTRSFAKAPPSPISVSEDPLPGLFICQADPVIVAPPAGSETNLAALTELLRVSDAQTERQRARFTEWRTRGPTSKQSELLSATEDAQRYFAVSAMPINLESPSRRRPESPPLTDDEVLLALAAEGGGNSGPARALAALGGWPPAGQQQPNRDTRFQFPLQRPQQQLQHQRMTTAAASLVEACQGVVREGRRYLLECAYPPCAGRTELGQRAATAATFGFRACRQCRRAYYCSRKCRSDHAVTHQRSCGRRARCLGACKRAIASLLGCQAALTRLSCLARASARCLGRRGCLLLALTDPEATAAGWRFPTEGSADLLRPPIFVPEGELPEPGDFDGLRDACRACDPETAFVVCVAVGGAVKWAKLCLGIPQTTPQKQAHCQSSTSILDSISVMEVAPVQEADVEPESQAEAVDAEKKRQRQIYFVRVQRSLRQRGVSLLHHFPQVHDSLTNYVETGKPFAPISIQPTDCTSGRVFAFRLAPGEEPESELVADNSGVFGGGGGGSERSSRRSIVMSTDL